MKIKVIIPGLGKPRYALKIATLRQNLQTLLAKQSAQYAIEVIIFQYDSKNIMDYIPEFADRVKVHRGRGIVGEFLHVMTPARLHGNDYVIILLDDIVLGSDFKLDRLIAWKKQHNLDIVSPSLTVESNPGWTYMRQKPYSNYEGFEVRRCELFCYLMDMRSYGRYHAYVRKYNPWMWGMDVMLREVMGLRVGLHNKIAVIHLIKGAAYKYRPDHNPHEDLTKFLSEF